MRQEHFIVESNRHAGAGLYRLELSGNTEDIRADGQFVNVSVPGKYLRRPFSVYRVIPGRLTLLYKVAGSGTSLMAEWTPGTVVHMLTGLGSGYDLSRCGDKPLIVGGGYGSASVYGLARELALEGKAPSVVLGFDTQEEAVVLEDFIGLIQFGASVRLATRDGSAGIQGLVTDLIDTSQQSTNPLYSFIYACGPLPMLRALSDQLPELPGQFSLEARMGCGFGACMGCTIQTTRGPLRVCKEGPVFDKGEIIWT